MKIIVSFVAAAMASAVLIQAAPLPAQLHKESDGIVTPALQQASELEANSRDVARDVLEKREEESQLDSRGWYGKLKIPCEVVSCAVDEKTYGRTASGHLDLESYTLDQVKNLIDHAELYSWSRKLNAEGLKETAKNSFKEALQYHNAQKDDWIAFNVLRKIWGRYGDLMREAHAFPTKEKPGKSVKDSATSS